MYPRKSLRGLEAVILSHKSHLNTLNGMTLNRNWKYFKL